MRSLLGNLWRDERSAATAEYSIVFALLACLLLASNAVSLRTRHYSVYTAVVSPARNNAVLEITPDSDTTFEQHYRIKDLAERWKIGRESVRLAVKDDPGVLKMRHGRKKAHTTYSVPESVARKIHTKLLNGI